MTSTPSGAPDGANDTDGTDAAVSFAVSREQLVVAVIVVAQALWLGMIMLRGWYSAADLPNIAYATGRPLGWDYLSSTLGGHFGVAQRSIYWLLNRAAPLEWWVTVVLRLVFQALATVLLWRLLRALVGYRPWLLMVLALYASSAYLVPGVAALNSGLGLSISQACLVGALLAHVRYHRGRRLADAVLAAVLVLLMLAFAQGSLPTLIIFPVVSIAFLSTGPWRGRLANELTLWPGWALLAGALAVLAAFYVIGGDYNSPSSEFTPRDALWMVGQAWVAVLGAALLGGPWSYYVLPDQWSAYADVPIVLAVAGQLALLALVVLSVRRTGPVALVAWAIPAWIAVTSLLLVGSSRWSSLGENIPSAMRYSHFLPVALALGAALAFGSPHGQDRSRTADRRGTRDGARFAPGRRLVAAGTGLVVVASMFSTWRFAEVFWDNPARDYTAALLRDVGERGPGVQVHDTLLPEAVVPYVSQMHVSDLVALGGAEADFGGQSEDRLTVDGRGRLATTRFVKSADFIGPRKKACGVHVYGRGTTLIPLGHLAVPREWFLQLELYQPRDNRVTLRVIDRDDRELAVIGGNELTLRGSLVVIHRRLSPGTPALLEVTATDPQTNLCLVHTYAGVPLP
ncbi:hypothetical protein AAII07_15815 [Microvirga sp. 0TCS3.31]